MKINRQLNLVIPVREGVYVHSVPVSRETFETYFLVMSKAFSAIFTQGLGAVAGPRVAALMLKQVAGDDWDSVKKGLVGEVVRLSNVCFLGDNGWETLPLHTAFERGVLDEEDRADIEGELIFFTLVARMNKREQVLPIMETVNGLWGSEVTAQPFTEWRDSLPTSTPDENTGETPTSSLPG